MHSLLSIIGDQKRYSSVEKSEPCPFGVVGSIGFDPRREVMFFLSLFGDHFFKTPVNETKATGLKLRTQTSKPRPQRLSLIAKAPKPQSRTLKALASEPRPQNLRGRFVILYPNMSELLYCPKFSRFIVL